MSDIASAAARCICCCIASALYIQMLFVMFCKYSVLRCLGIFPDKEIVRQEFGAQGNPVTSRKSPVQSQFGLNYDCNWVELRLQFGLNCVWNLGYSTIAVWAVRPHEC